MSVVLFHCQSFESLAVCLTVSGFGVDHHQHLVFQCWPVSAVCVSVWPGVSGVWCWPPSAACVSVLAGVGSMCFSLAWCQWCLVLTTISLCFGVGQCQQRVFQCWPVSGGVLPGGVLPGVSGVLVLTTISLCFGVGQCQQHVFQSCLVSVVFWCWPPSAPCVSVLAGVGCQQCVSVLPGVSGVLVFSTISTLCFSVGRCQQCVFQSCLVSVLLTSISGLCFSVDPREGRVPGLWSRLLAGCRHVPLPGGLDHDLALSAQRRQRRPAAFVPQAGQSAHRGPQRPARPHAGLHRAPRAGHAQLQRSTARWLPGVGAGEGGGGQGMGGVHKGACWQN